MGRHTNTPPQGLSTKPPHLQQKGQGWISKHLPALIVPDSRFLAKENKPELKYFHFPHSSNLQTLLLRLMPDPSLQSQIKPLPSCSPSTPGQQPTQLHALRASKPLRRTEQDLKNCWQNITCLAGHSSTCPKTAPGPEQTAHLR